MRHLVEPLLTFRSMHKHYADMICRDLEFQPTPACQRKLADHKMIFKKNKDGFSLYYEASKAKTPILQAATGTVFTFTVQLKNPFFTNFTRLHKSTLDHLKRPKGILMFKNEDTDPALESTLADLRPSQFTHAFKTDDKTATLQIFDPSGLKIKEVQLVNENMVFNYSVDLRTEGLYEFRQISGGKTTMTDYYVSNDLYRQPVFGIIRIINGPPIPFNYSDPQTFRILFHAVEKSWKYYIVMKTKDKQDYEFNIEDKGFAQANNPEIKFIKRDIINKDIKVLENADQTVIYFHSGTMQNGQFKPQFISSSDIPRQQIQLKRKKAGEINGSNETILVPNLPNPAIDNLKSSMIIYI